jgi:hypothetical protein
MAGESTAERNFGNLPHITISRLTTAEQYRWIPQDE